MTMLRVETIKVTKEEKRDSGFKSKGYQPKWQKPSIWVKQNSRGYEDKAEFLASKVLQHSTLQPYEYTNYHLCTISFEGVELKGCYSKNFLDEGCSLITLDNLMHHTRFNFRLHNYRKESVDRQFDQLVTHMKRVVNLDIEDFIRKTITLDALILNEDRHLSNIAFILNRGGGLKPTPIFDNGLSLLSDELDYKYDTDYKLLTEVVTSKPFSPHFTEQLESIGVGFHVNGESLLRELEPFKAELGRAYKVLEYQLNKYRGSIVF